MTVPRALGIDYGDAHIGLAISDDLGMLAHPLETIHTRRTADPIERIVAIVAARKIATVVIGLPLRMDGSEGSAVAKVRAFAAKLRVRLPDSEFVEIDERLSTVEAQRRLHEAGRTIMTSRAVIDQAAAATILQEFLDERAGPPEVPDFDQGDD